MKIKGWEKLNGICYKDYCILNPIHNSIMTHYIADVMNLITKNKIQLKLDFDAGFDEYIAMLNLSDVNHNISVNRVINLVMLNSISNFRLVFELCLDDYLKEIKNKSVSQTSLNTYTF